MPARRRARLRPAPPPAAALSSALGSLDDEDHGRDLRVAAVDPLPRLGPVDRRGRVAADQLAATASGGVGLDHEGVGHGRRRGGLRPGLAPVTSSRGALGVRPALAEGEVRASSCGPSRIVRLLSRGSHSRSPSSIVRSVSHGSSDLLPSAPRASRLKTRAWLQAGADLDVEGHRATLAVSLAANWNDPAMPPACPTAVVFDNDGLLLDTESVWTRAEQDLFERRGTRVHPGRQARAGRHLGRDRRRRSSSGGWASRAARRS